MRTANLKSILFVISLSALFCRPAGAQTNYQFSSFQCDPLSCSEEGPPMKSGHVSADLNSTCTGGAISGINKSITVTLANCSVNYIPYVLIQKSTTEFYDDNTCPPTAYYIDYATFNGEVFTVGGVVKYHSETTYGCDGSESGPTNLGTKPC